MQWVLSIDPGISGTGLSIWDFKQWNELKPPDWTRNYYAYETAKDWKEKIHDIHFKIRQDIKMLNSDGDTIVMVFSEIPKDFDSAYGQAAAKEGSVIKLGVFCGYLLHEFYQSGIPVEFVDVNDHKGQAPKHVVEKQIKKLFPGLEVSSHGVDAVSIGLWAKGFKLDGTRRSAS